MEERPLQSTIEELVTQHAQAVFRYAYRLAGSLADAEDLTQETFLLAAKNLGQLADRSRAQGWLLAITRNAFLRQRRLPQVTLLGDMTGTAEKLAIDSNGPDEEMIQLALKSLSEEQRIMVLMFYFEDLSYKEIAEQLGIPIGTVMSRLARAKAVLRKRLDVLYKKAAPV
ncbi:MAG: RNA polymerase sigma factor [Thermogutta sp.]